MEAQSAKIEADNAAVAKTAQAKPPADPVLAEVVEQDVKLPVIETKEREPQSIMEALNRPMQVGESFGSWRR